MGGTGGLSRHTRSERRQSTAAFSGGEAGMRGDTMEGYGGTPRLNNGGYAMGTGSGYAPAETTPQKATAIRDEYGNHSPAHSEDRFKQKAK